MREIREIVVHCSDSDWGSRKVIDKWHKDRGWDEIGYHFVITNGFTEYARPYMDINDGVIQRGRAIDKVGAHVKGKNKYSVGICLIGKKHFSGSQMKSLTELIDKLLKKYKLTVKNVYGHYEFDNNKTCPNIEMDWFRAFFRDL